MEQITEISIKEISLSGFRNQKELVSFALGDVNCVTGHNGTGKTTLAHAVAFAFYGVTYFGEQKADRLINSESAGCEVKVDFSDQNGVLHSLIRRRFGSKTELIFDSFSVRQEEINRFICDKDTFLCIFNPFYLTSFGEARGRELIFRNLKTVGSDSILAAISDGFKKPLEGISITEPGVMLSFYRAGIRRCDEQIKIAEAKRATLRETVQANDAECDRLNEQAEVSAATVHILKEKQFSGLDLNSFRQRRSELTEHRLFSPQNIADFPTRVRSLTPGSTNLRVPLFPSVSFHSIRWLRNFNRMCIDYASRPRLSSRLTLGGRTFPRKP